MTSINTAGGYYQLSNLLSGNQAQQPDSSDALLHAISSLSGGNSSSGNNSDAFLLDLSPQAQQILNGAGNANSAGSSALQSGNFSLTADQQQKIADILAKYKDAPYNQDTFEQIQNDLGNAELGTSTLSMEDQVKSFDPTTVLIAALNGDTSALGSGPGFGATPQEEDAKSQSYMQQIIKQWQSISSDYKSQQSAQTVSATGAAGGA